MPRRKRRGETGEWVRIPPRNILVEVKDGRIHFTRENIHVSVKRFNNEIMLSPGREEVVTVEREELDQHLWPIWHIDEYLVRNNDGHGEKELISSNPKEVIREEMSLS